MFPKWSIYAIIGLSVAGTIMVVKGFREIRKIEKEERGAKKNE